MMLHDAPAPSPAGLRPAPLGPPLGAPAYLQLRAGATSRRPMGRLPPGVPRASGPSTPGQRRPRPSPPLRPGAPRCSPLARAACSATVRGAKTRGSRSWRPSGLRRTSGGSRACSRRSRRRRGCSCPQGRGGPDRRFLLSECPPIVGCSLQRDAMPTRGSMDVPLVMSYVLSHAGSRSKGSLRVCPGGGLPRYFEII